MLLITGGSGFLGRAVATLLPQAKALSSAELDLTNGGAVDAAIAEWQPEIVVHLAARVGGIVANSTRQADFLVDNLRVDANLLAALRRYSPSHLIATLSTCMYPDRLRGDSYPMTESLIEAGAPQATNAGYAAAKRALWHGVLALSDQYGVEYSALVPANLYGPGDHFGARDSHFLAAAVHKIELARCVGQPRVEFMGTGKALRQYLYVEDLARLIAHLVEKGPLNATVNVAPEHNLSIRELACTVAETVGYGGEIEFTGTGPDGQLRKDVTTSLLNNLGPAWPAMETPLREGLVRTVEWYREHVASR